MGLSNLPPGCTNRDIEGNASYLIALEEEKTKAERVVKDWDGQDVLELIICIAQKFQYPYKLIEEEFRAMRQRKEEVKRKEELYHALNNLMLALPMPTSAWRNEFNAALEVLKKAQH